MKSLVSMKEMLAFFSNCFEDSAQQEFFLHQFPKLRKQSSRIKEYKMAQLVKNDQRLSQ